MIRSIRLLSLLIIMAATFVGCDTSASKHIRMINDNDGNGINYIETSLLDEVTEATIRKTLLAEIEKNITNIEDFDNVKSALLQLDEVSAGKQLKYKLPADVQKLETGDIKMLLKSFIAIVGMKYNFENKIMFNCELLKIPEILSSKHKATAELLVYWHWKNCFSSNNVFHGTKTDYAPFTENELSALFWSYLLTEYIGDKYRDSIAGKLVFMNIIELKEEKYAVTESWLAKLKQDLDSSYDSKINEKYSLMQPEYCTYELLRTINNEENGYLYGKLGGGGGGDSLFGWRFPRSGYEGTIIKKRKEKTIPKDVLNKYKSEATLSITEIKGLLSSEDYKTRFRGVVHMLKYMHDEEDYSDIDLMIDALDVNSPQLVKLVISRLSKMLAQENEDNKKLIKNFIYNLVAKKNYNLSEFLEFAISISDKKYFDKFVELLLNYKFIDPKDQTKIIDHIVETKRKDLIPKLYSWRFNFEKREEANYIAEHKFFEKMCSLDRHESMLNTVKVLKSTSGKSYRDAIDLGYTFLRETTDADISFSFSKKRKIFVVDADKINKNRQYLQSANLFQNYFLKTDTYSIVASHCNIRFDQIVYEWFAYEKNENLQMTLLRSFADNTLNFKIDDDRHLQYKEYDPENDDIDAVMAKIRYNEKRFTTFASYVMQSEYKIVQDELFEIAPYLRADDAWRIIKHNFDLNDQNEDLGDYFYKIDRLKPDTLGLIEIDKLKQYLYTYLIDKLVHKNHKNGFLTALRILNY